MKSFIHKLGFVSCLLFMNVGSALAMEAQHVGIGILGGGLIPTRDTSLGRFNYGIDFTYHFVPKFEVGLEIANTGASIGNVDGIFSILAEFNYHFVDDSVGSFYLGARAGALNEWKGNSTLVYFGYGEHIGLDLALGSHISLGPKIALTHGVNTVTTLWVSTLLQLKYWF